MTRFAQFDRALRERGWTYDVEREVSRAGKRRIDEAEKLLALLPEMTLDELVSYQDDQYDKSRRRTVKKG